MGSVPDWGYTHPLSTGILTLLLESRIAGIHAVAVAPDYRQRGIAAALIHSAEQHFRNTGYGLVTGAHLPALSGYYARLGYQSAQTLILLTPDGRGLFGQETPGYLMAAKPLVPGVEVVTVPGAPAPIVHGLFPACRLPAGVRWDGDHLTT